MASCRSSNNLTNYFIYFVNVVSLRQLCCFQNFTEMFLILIFVAILALVTDAGMLIVRHVFVVNYISSLLNIIGS